MFHCVFATLPDFKTIIRTAVVRNNGNALNSENGNGKNDKS